MLALILENEAAKLLAVLNKFELWQQPFYATKWEVDALAFLRQQCQEMTLYIDYELDPGCGDGLSFLMEAIKEKAHWIKKVICTSSSDRAGKEFYNVCYRAGIPFQYARLLR